MGTMGTFLHIYSAIVLLTLTSADPTTKAEDYRLPKTVIPSHYTLDLVIDPENTTYTGFVEITATAKNITNGVVKLHASPEHLKLGIVLFNYKSSCNVTESNNVTQIVTLACPAPLDGEFTLTIDFEGVFSIQDMDGIYKSTYEEDGKQQVLISTQFESTAARRMFPCFDEPSYKATFDIFVTHPTEYSVLANTPIQETYAAGTGQVQTRFEKTPIMSTYLVALVVSKFSANVNANPAKYDFQVYARPEAKNFTAVATTNGPTLIDILSKWTGINYEDLGNSHVYLVAIPDFAAGAMENWGLITFREVDLLDEGEKTSLAAEQRILTVVAHELTHQWFGDYVTLDWWSDTWLNEGFATYFEFYAPDQLNSSFELDRQFVVTVLQPVLQVDARPSTLPMSSAEGDINSPAEDSKKFDDISYDKAGSVIRMMRNILGEATFKKGLQLYLKRYNYTNTNPTRLLGALQEAIGGNGLDIVNIMNSWIYKAGFPLVTVQLNEDGTSVHLTQERFIAADNNTQVENTQWYIPISYTTSKEKDFTVSIKNWLQPNAAINITVEDSWIIFNLQHAGFYRVNYDDDLWDRIITALKNDTERDSIDVLSRAQLIDDVFNIARVGKVDYETAFQLTEYLNKETEYYPWVSALNSISYIYGKLGDQEAETLLQNTILRWITSAFPNGTNTGNSVIDTIKDSYILDWACKVGQEECISYAKETFDGYKNTSSLPDYNKRTLVFCHALRNSDDPSADYDILFNVFQNSKSSIEQNAIISALGCINDNDVLSNYLSETINPSSSVRKQDAASVFKAVYTNSDVGVNVSLTFLENNLDTIRERYKGMSALSSLITGLANKLTTDEQIDRLEKIITASSGVEEIQLVAQQARDIISANKAFTDKYGAIIKKILRDLPNDANSLRPKYFFTIMLCFAGLYMIHF